MIEIEINQAPRKLKDGAIILALLENGISLICDARNEQSIKTLREIKSRAHDKGFTILMDSDARVNRYVKEVPALAWDIFDTAVDPLILVLPGGANVAKNALAQDGTIAIRLVADAYEREIVQAANGPVASTALLKTDGSLALSLDEANPEVLEKIDYVLPLPPEIKNYSKKKIPIIFLDSDNSVKIIRE